MKSNSEKRWQVPKIHPLQSALHSLNSPGTIESTTNENKSIVDGNVGVN